MTMTLNEYQLAAGKTNKGTRLFVREKCSGLLKPEATEYEDGVGYRYREVEGLCNTLAMNGEAGELAEKIKKAARDGETDYLAARELKAKELGDVLWYISQAARDFGYTLDEIAEINLKKLRDREARGVLSGSGDNR